MKSVSGCRLRVSLTEGTYASCIVADDFLIMIIVECFVNDGRLN